MSKAPSCLSSRAGLPTKPERTLRDVGCASRLVRSIIPAPPEDALCTSRGLVYPISGRPPPNKALQLPRSGRPGYSANRVIHSEDIMSKLRLALSFVFPLSFGASTAFAQLE